MDQEVGGSSPPSCTRLKIQEKYHTTDPSIGPQNSGTLTMFRQCGAVYANRVETANIPSTQLVRRPHTSPTTVEAINWSPSKAHTARRAAALLRRSITMEGPQGARTQKTIPTPPRPWSCQDVDHSALLWPRRVSARGVRDQHPHDLKARTARHPRRRWFGWPWQHGAGLSWRAVMALVANGAGNAD